MQGSPTSFLKEPKSDVFSGLLNRKWTIFRLGSGLDFGRHRGSIDIIKFEKNQRRIGFDLTWNHSKGSMLSCGPRFGDLCYSVKNLRISVDFKVDFPIVLIHEAFISIKLFNSISFSSHFSKSFPGSCLQSKCLCSVQSWIRNIIRITWDMVATMVALEVGRVLIITATIIRIKIVIKIRVHLQTVMVVLVAGME